MSKSLRLLTLLLLAALCWTLPTGSADAAVSAFVARDGLNKYYQYQYEDLLESYVISLLGGEGDLYRHYADRRTAAMVHAEKGYVDYEDVLEAYAVSIITGTSFDLDTYIAREGKPLELPPTLMVVSQEGEELLEEEFWLKKKPEEGLLEKVAASKDGPLPVLTRVRWEALGEGEDLQYYWYIYRNGRHVRSFWYGNEDYLDFVPTDPGTFQVRAFAVCPEGYAHESYSEELVMEETVVIEKPELDFREPFRLILDPIEKVIQHHMANPTWDVYQVHNFHRNRIHWLDETTWEHWIGIGYNYWIGFDGTIYETRGRHYGSHAGSNWNGRSLGVGYQGDFTEQEMTDEQLESGAWLNAKLLIDEGLVLEDIWGHRDVSNTACPGINFRSEEVLERTAAILELVFGD